MRVYDSRGHRVAYEVDIAAAGTDIIVLGPFRAGQGVERLTFALVDDGVGTGGTISVEVYAHNSKPTVTNYTSGRPLTNTGTGVIPTIPYGPLSGGATMLSVPVDFIADTKERYLSVTLTPATDVAGSLWPRYCEDKP